MSGLSVRKKIACILFAFITFVVGIYCAFDMIDFISVVDNSTLPYSVHTISAVSLVESNDAVIRSGRNEFDIEFNSICKPKHIQLRISFGIREYFVTSVTVIVLFSLLKARYSSFGDEIAGTFHLIILYIHNKDGSKPVTA